MFLAALVASACGEDPGTRAASEGSGGPVDGDIGSGAFQLVATQTDGVLTASLLSTPPDVGAAIVQTVAGTVVVPGTSNLYFCDSVERFCDDLAIIPMPLDTSDLGLPTAALIDGGALIVAHERGIVRLPPRLDDVEVLLRFSDLEANHVRNVTSLQIVMGDDGRRYLLAPGVIDFTALTVDDAGGFRALDRTRQRAMLATSIVLLDLDPHPDEVVFSEWGHEASFDSELLSMTDVLVGDDFGADLLCRVVGGALDCEPQDGAATMALVRVDPDSALVRNTVGTAPDRDYLMSSQFGELTVISVEHAPRGFDHHFLRVDQPADIGTARVVYWGLAPAMPDGTVVVSSGGVQPAFDVMLGYPTPPCTTVLDVRDADVGPDEGHFASVARVCAAKQTADGSIVYAARDILSLGANRFVGWPHLSAFLPGGSRNAWTYEIAAPP